MATSPSDIFSQLGDLFRNKRPAGEVHVFVLHRFLASSKDFAPFAKELSVIWDDSLVVEIWRSALPFTPNLPFLRYPAPKKPPAAAEIVRRIAEVEGYTLSEAETAFLLLDSRGLSDQVFQHYGVDPGKDRGVFKYGSKT